MWNEAKLDALLTQPSERLIADMRRIQGNIMVIGAGGKMGPTLCVLAQRAMQAAGCAGHVIAVSRFSDPFASQLLEKYGVETIAADVMQEGALERLPDCENVIYMIGRKFGTNGSEYQTWASNVVLPVRVADRFRDSRIVVFSSGNIYPMLDARSGGATEATRPDPMGEYAMSCLGRERVFENASRAYGTRVLIYRLNYAVDLRYGVLYDIASAVHAGRPVSLGSAAFNCIWQGDACEYAIRGLLLAESPMRILNVTGPETLSVRAVAERFAREFGVEAVFEGEMGDRSLLSNSGACMKALGYPAVCADQMIQWQSEWIAEGGRSLAKPTHFETRDGKY